MIWKNELIFNVMYDFFAKTNIYIYMFQINRSHNKLNLGISLFKYIPPDC